MNLAVEIYDSSWIDISAYVIEDSFPKWFPIGFRGIGYYSFQAQGVNFRVLNYTRPDRYTPIRLKRDSVVIFEGYIDRVTWKSTSSFSLTIHPYSLILKDVTGHTVHYGYVSGSDYPYATCDPLSFATMIGDKIDDLNDAVADLIPTLAFTTDVGDITRLYNGAWGVLRILYEGEMANSDYDDSWLARWQFIEDGSGTLYYAQGTDDDGFRVYSVGDPPLFYLTEVASGLSAQDLESFYGEFWSDDPGGFAGEIKRCASTEDTDFTPWELVLFQYITSHAADEVPVSLVVLRQEIGDIRAKYWVALVYRMNLMDSPPVDLHDVTFASMFTQFAMVSDLHYFIDGKEICWLGQDDDSADEWSVNSGGILTQEKKTGVTYNGKIDVKFKDAKLEGGIDWTERVLGFAVPQQFRDILDQRLWLRSIGSWEEITTVALADECVDLKLLAESDEHGKIFKIEYNSDGLRVRIHSRKRE